MTTTTRCALHDLLPGQCECTWTAPEVDYEQNRQAARRRYGWSEPDPQVTATIVAAPTTDRLRRRKGFDIPTIGYGHWSVLVDDSACREIKAAREAARHEAQREALLERLMAPRATLNATITIG